MKKYYVVISFSFFLFAEDIVCQPTNSNSDSIYQSKYLSNLKKILFEEITAKKFSKYDSLQIIPKPREILLDSFKYIIELEMVCKMDLGKVSDLNISEQLLQQKKRRELILFPTKVYYKNQPSYDLGTIGKYLKVSKNVAAIILAILSL